MSLSLIQAYESSDDEVESQHDAISNQVDTPEEALPTDSIQYQNPPNDENPANYENFSGTCLPHPENLSPAEDLGHVIPDDVGPVVTKKEKLPPGIGRREWEQMKKNGVWTELTTEHADPPDVAYNTPLPCYTQNCDTNQQPSSGDDSRTGHPGQELLQYQQSQMLGGSSGYWGQWYNQQGYSYPAYAGYPVYPPHPPPGTPPIKQKSFEELVEQDRQLNQFFNEGSGNTFILQREAFKSTFRGTRTYRMNNRTYNPKHFLQLTPGASKMAKTFSKDFKYGQGNQDKNKKYK